MKKITFKLMSTLSVAAMLFASSGAYAQYVKQPQQPPMNWKMAIPASKGPVGSLATQTLMDEYDVNYYKLDINLERTSTYISGNVIIQAKVTSAVLDTFGFQLHQDLTIDSVFINQQKLSYVRTDSADVHVGLSSSLSMGAPIVAQIYYHGTPPSGAQAAIGNGMNNASSPTWGNQVTWTLSEPYMAYEWWPCKQYLKDKADSSDVWITTDSTNKAGSNGLLTAVTPMPNGKERYEWKERYPIDYYLISATVAQYVEYDTYAHPIGDPNPLLVQNFVYNNPNTLSNFQSVIDQTDTLIYLYSKLYGPYPFQKEKYGHCMAPLSGGMEHQTMTTLGYFQFGLVAHELSHQWFGDNVTCATWEDIFMNEGFATYSEYLADEYLQPNQAASYMTNEHNSVMSQPNGSIFFTDTSSVPRIFDSRLSYDKGGSFLHMLRFATNNDTLFFNSLKAYQQVRAGGVGTGMDFKAVLDSVTGMDFTDMFNEWYFGQGYPTFNIRWNQNNGYLYLQNHETTSDSAVTPLFKLPIEYKITRSNGDTTIRLFQGQNTENYAMMMPGTVTGITVDPNDWLVDKVASDVHDTTMASVAPSLTDNENVSLYPNPCVNHFEVNLPHTGVYQQLMVYNMLGDVVLRKPVSGHSMLVNTSMLAPGIYIAKFTDNRGANSKLIRFVKQ